MMKLFGSYTSPYVRHCRIALLQEGKQEGVDFEFVETDYATSKAESPTAKVPFFQDGDLFLTDSSSITKYIREMAGKDFIPSVNDFDGYALVNTVMDSAINIFLLERDGITFENSDYLKRQAYRVAIGLAELDGLIKNRLSLGITIDNDFLLRTACFLDWGLYRQRFDFGDFENLVNLLVEAKENGIFESTSPP